MSTQDNKDKAVLLWTLGLPTSAIAERLGCSRDRIRKWTKEAGVRKPEDPPRQRYDGTGGGGRGVRARARLSQ